MPSAKRRFDRGPVSREVLDRHNKHHRETYWDVKAKQARDQRRPAFVPAFVRGYIASEEDY